MGGSIDVDKKSCRKLHYNSMLTESDMCSHCSELFVTQSMGAATVETNFASFATIKLGIVIVRSIINLKCPGNVILEGSLIGLAHWE
jgi:hypothetical protein